MRSARPVREARPLPLPALISGRARSTVYGLASVDDRGRVVDGTVLRALGWTDRTPLAAGLNAGRIIIQPSRPSGSTLARRGRVLLPVGVRRACRLETGDRVLLAAEPADGVLTVYPPAVLDVLLRDATVPATVLGGAA